MTSGFTLQDWASVADVIVGIASTITAIVAVAALLFAKRQLEQARASAAQLTTDSANTDATRIYRSLIEKALEYPQFISPGCLVDTKQETFDGNKVEFRRYEIFVELILTTFDCDFDAQDKYIKAYIVQWLGEHATYLGSPYFERYFGSQISPNLRKTIKKALQSSQA